MLYLIERINTLSSALHYILSTDIYQSMMNEKIIDILMPQLSSWAPYQRIAAWIAQAYSQNGSSSLKVGDYSGTSLNFMLLLLTHSILQAGKSVLLQQSDGSNGRQLSEQLQEEGYPAYYLPSWEEVTDFSIDYIAMERSVALNQLTEDYPGVIVGTEAAFNSPFPKRKDIIARQLRLITGMSSSPPQLSTQLANMGYHRVANARMPGEFAARGEVLDIYPIMSTHPWRLHFHFDTIESIQGYDPLTQRNQDQKEREKIKLLVAPLSEWKFSKEDIPTLRTEMHALEPSSSDQLLATLDETDSWLALAFLGRQWTALSTISSTRSIKIVVQDVSAIEGREELVLKNNSQYVHNNIHSTISQYVYKKIQSSQSAAQHLPILYLCHQFDSEGDWIALPSRQPPTLYGNWELFSQECQRLQGLGISPILAINDRNALSTRATQFPQCRVTFSTLTAGLYISAARIAIFTEHNLFPLKRDDETAVSSLESQTSLYEQLYSIDQISTGDYVVHSRHGIGRYEGLERLQNRNMRRDYLVLSYDKDERIYLPIEQINLVRKYTALSGSPPTRDTLGGAAWERRRRRVAQHTQEMATHLLRLYARRSLQRGFAFPSAPEWMEIIAQRFPHQPTVSQLRTISEVMEDMGRPLPMDRLICGDVGYGKTEIAIRAACRALHAEKQVAILVPTTILAEQHYHTMQERFSDLPIKLAMLSRLISPTKQRTLLAQLRNHTIDLVIGTHRLLQADVAFHDLGLLIIDEEQRFGVRHKEHLKSFKGSVDILSMTATPIPRTLHLSLTHLRDISLLNDPPRNRRAIHTTVAEFNNELVAQAIRRELQRGGQVFWLHNRIETIEKMSHTISQLVPQAQLRYAHGALSATLLDSIMYDFVHQVFDILVTTTIIENGIDIPNVNTLILERADLLGVSQLYQLRGRIGRSSRQAYALLLYPNAALLDSRVAERLQTIAQYSDLGSGFAIALRDLEVRGAGNILGTQQSGDIHAVGYEMYVKLLDNAIQRLRNGSARLQAPEPYLELHYDGYIPDDYIDNPQSRLEVYQKIALVDNSQDIQQLQEELVERFGALPPILQTLLHIAEIRLACRKLHIISIRERPSRIEAVLGKMACLNQQRLTALIAKGNITPAPRSPHILHILPTEGPSRHEHLIALLNQLQPASSPLEEN